MSQRTNSSHASRNWRTSGVRRGPSKFARLVRLAILGVTAIALVALLIWLVMPTPTSDLFLLSFEPPEYRADHAYHLVPYPELPIEASRWGGLRIGERSSLSDPDSVIEDFNKQLRSAGIEDRDRLVVFVTAQGVSFDSKAYLLTDADGSRPPGDQIGEMLEMERLLQALSESGDHLKLLVLDAGDLGADPWSGRIVNEFSRNLRAAVQKTNDQSLWVLCSHDVQERSQVSDQFHQSVFAHYLAEGLSGDADQTKEQGAQREIDLHELYEYVRTQVNAWCEATGSERQTPYLIHGGGQDADNELSKQFIVAIAQSPESESHASSARSSEYGSQHAARIASTLKRRIPWRQTGDGRNVVGRWVKPNRPLALISFGQAAQESTPQGAPRPSVRSGPSSQRQQPENNSGDPPRETEQRENDAQPAESPGRQGGDREAAQSPKSTEATPAASNPEPKKEAASDENELGALLHKAWLLRDEIEDRRAGAASSPVDYAPHLWRQIQERLVGYERILRSGADSPQVVDELKIRIIPALQALRDGKSPHPGGAEAIKRAHESSPAFDSKLSNPDPRSLAMSSHLPWNVNQSDAKSDAEAIRQSLGGDAPEAAQTPWHDNVFEARWPEWIDAAQVEQDPGVRGQVIDACIMGERAAAFAPWCEPLVRKDVSQGDRALWQALRDHPAKMQDHAAEAAQHFERATDRVKVVERSIQLHNELVYRAPYYIRWYQRNQPLGVNEPTFAQLTQLFERIANHSHQLDRVFVGSNDPSRTTEALSAIADDLASAQQRIEAPLKSERLKDFDQPRSIGEIDALLSTPLVAGPDRRLLIEKLDKLEPDVAPFNPRRVPKRRTPSVEWRRVRDRGDLAAGLLEILIPDPQAGTKTTQDDQRQFATALEGAKRRLGDFETWLAGGGTSIDDAPWRACEQLGAEFRECYALVRWQSSSNILRKWRSSQDSDPSDLAYYESLQRVLDARDAVITSALQIRRRAELVQLLRWHRERFLDAIDGASAAQARYLADSARAYSGQAAALFDPAAGSLLGSDLRVTSLSITSASSLDFSRFDLSNLEQEPEYLRFRIEAPTTGRNGEQFPVWVAVRYDRSLLDVESLREAEIYRYDDASGRPTKENRRSLLLTPGRAFDLEILVRPRRASSRRTRLILDVFTEATLAARRVADTMVYATRNVEITLPTPNIARLVVLEQEADAIAPSRVWRLQGRTLELAPFPNTETSYRFGLINDEGAAKTVRAALYAADSNFRPLGPPLAGSATMELPARDLVDDNGDALPIPFELYKNEPSAAVSPATDTAQGASADPTADRDSPTPGDGLEGTRIGNLVCVVERLAPPEQAESADSEAKPDGEPQGPTVEKEPLVVAETTFRIDIRPRRPRGYLAVSHDFDPVKGEIRFVVRPSFRGDVPPGGSRIVWVRDDAVSYDSAQTLPEGTGGNFEAELSPNDPEGIELYANVSSARDLTLIVSLTVDDCPRAFVYQVNCRSGVIDELRNLPPEVWILRQGAPMEKHSAYGSRQRRIPIEVRVNAPNDELAAHPGRVGIDHDKNHSLGTDTGVASFRVDREATTALVDVDPEKGILIATQVRYLRYEVDPQGVDNEKREILVERDGEIWQSSEPASLTFDLTPPAVDLVRPRGAEVGKDLVVRARAWDDLTEIRDVEFVILPENQERKLDDPASGEMEFIQGSPRGDRMWEAPLKSDELGPHVVAVRARDLVGHESRFSRSRIEVSPKPPPVDVANSIVVQVTYKKSPLRRKSTVELFQGGTEPIMQAETNDNGVCVFENLQPGSYTLRAKGQPIGRPVYGEAAVTLKASPAPPARKPVDLLSLQDPSDES